MELLLKRKWFSDESTIGELFVDGEDCCYILEDVVRDKKIKGKTAIPYGSYKVVIDFSNRFQKDMPHLLDVPDFAGIRIHPGNTSKDTEGCLLPGLVKGVNTVLRSAVAYTHLFGLLKKAKDDIWITIVEERVL